MYYLAETNSKSLKLVDSFDKIGYLSSVIYRYCLINDLEIIDDESCIDTPGHYLVQISKLKYKVVKATLNEGYIYNRLDVDTNYYLEVVYFEKCERGIHWLVQGSF